MRAARLWLIAIIVATMSWAGIQPAAAAQAVSAVRLVNAVQGGHALSLLETQSGSLAAYIAFRHASDYVVVEAGSRNFTITGDTGAPIELSARLRPMQHYTLAVVGRAAQATTYLFEDDPWPSGNGLRLRLYHLSFDSPAVDLRIAGGETLITNTAFPDASDYIMVPEADMLTVFPAQVAAPELAHVQLGPGQNQSVFVVGDLATISAFAHDDVPVLIPQPVSLPNTSGEEMPLLPLLLMGSCAIIAGALLQLRQRHLREQVEILT